MNLANIVLLFYAGQRSVHMGARSLKTLCDLYKNIKEAKEVSLEAFLISIIIVSITIFVLLLVVKLLSLYNFERKNKMIKVELARSSKRIYSGVGK
jgi:uncharacterized protein HemY